ncbi:MAG: T9SS type A sorting domain-containing protein, partial [Rufibacter sp.]
VNALPTVTATSSAPSVCPGGSVTLTATGGTKYTWSPATGLSNAAIANPVASPTETTTYTVTGFSSSGCSSTAQVTVAVNSATATIQPSGTTALCPGGNVTLTASTGASYLWSTGETTSAITVSSAGSYTVMVTNAAGCQATSAPTVVTMNLAPTVTLANFSNVCKDRSSFTLTGGSPAGGTYSGLGVANNQFSAAVAGPGVHTITYSYTSESGCTASASKTLTVENCLSTADELQAATLKVFPNPAQAEVNITVTLTKKEEVILQLTDLKGLVLYKTTVLAPAGELEKAIPVRELPQGMYLLQYRTAGATATKKVVIAR